MANGDEEEPLFFLSFIFFCSFRLIFIDIVTTECVDLGAVGLIDGLGFITQTSSTYIYRPFIKFFSRPPAMLTMFLCVQYNRDQSENTRECEKEKVNNTTHLTCWFFYAYKYGDWFVCRWLVGSVRSVQSAVVLFYFIFFLIKNLI